MLCELPPSLPSVDDDSRYTTMLQNDITEDRGIVRRLPLTATFLLSTTLPLTACTVTVGDGDESESGTPSMDSTGDTMTATMTLTDDGSGGSTGATTAGTATQSGTGGTAGTGDATSTAGTGSDATGTDTSGDMGVRGEVLGYFDGDAGYQKSAADWPLEETDWESDSTSVSVAALINGQFQVVGTGNVESDSDFRLELGVVPEGTTAGLHPIVASFTGNEGEFASALAWAEIDAAGEVVGSVELPPVGHESRLETEAAIAVATALGGFGEVNLNGLMAHVTAEVGSRVADGAELTGALVDAQRAQLEAMANATGRVVSPGELQAIEAGAHAEFISDLRSDTDVGSQFEAYVDFVDDTLREQASGLSLEAEQVVDATTQGSWAFATHLKATGHAAADVAATSAGQLAVLADVMAARSIAADAQLDENVIDELDDRIEDFLDSSATAADVQAVLEAQAQLRADVGVDGDELGAVVDDWIEASDGAELTVRNQIETTMAVIAELRNDLETALSAAAESADAVSLAAAAQVTFESSVRTQWESAATVAGMGAADVDFFTQLSCVGRVSTEGLIQQF